MPVVLATRTRTREYDRVRCALADIIIIDSLLHWTVNCVDYRCRSHNTFVFTIIFFCCIFFCLDSDMVATCCEMVESDHKFWFHSQLHTENIHFTVRYALRMAMVCRRQRQTLTALQINEIQYTIHTQTHRTLFCLVGHAVVVRGHSTGCCCTTYQTTTTTNTNNYHTKVGKRCLIKQIGIIFPRRSF